MNAMCHDKIINIRWYGVIQLLIMLCYAVHLQYEKSLYQFIGLWIRVFVELDIALSCVVGVGRLVVITKELILFVLLHAVMSYSFMMLWIIYLCGQMLCLLCTVLVMVISLFLFLVKNIVKKNNYFSIYCGKVSNRNWVKFLFVKHTGWDLLIHWIFPSSYVKNSVINVDKDLSSANHDFATVLFS